MKAGDLERGFRSPDVNSHRLLRVAVSWATILSGFGWIPSGGHMFSGQAPESSWKITHTQG